MFFLFCNFQSRYGFDCVEIKQLYGYDDLNFYVVDDDACEMLLKVYNEAYSTSTGHIDGECATLAFLTSQGFPVPKLRKTLKGQNYYIMGWSSLFFLFFF